MAKRILCVEDDATLRWAITEMLNFTGYEVIEAENGLTGIVLASSHHPDLILMDINLPGISGLEAMAQIRAKLEPSHIPIIIMTAGSSYDSCEEFVSLGCDDCIFKPFDIENLEGLVRRFLD
jgi:DNA-binding response OmpR family regulator